MTARDDYGRHGVGQRSATSLPAKQREAEIRRAFDEMVKLREGEDAVRAFERSWAKTHNRR